MRNAVEPVDDNTVLLSIHDISPVYEDDIVRTYDLLSDMEISSFTLLVTPFYGMKKSNTFYQGSPFSEYLLSLNLEISLHGYSHFTKSGAMNEFSSMSTNRTYTRLKDGMTLIRKGFGRNPIGFIPPLWDSPPRAIKAAKEVGLQYCTEGNNIHRTSDSVIYSTAELIVSQGLNRLNIETAIFEIELGGALQIAIHPKDHRMNNLFDLLMDLKDRQDYRFLSYQDYLSSKV